MASRRIDKRHIRNIQQSHGTYYITIPVDMVRSLKWRERQKVVVKKFGKGIRIVDWKPKSERQ